MCSGMVAVLKMLKFTTNFKMFRCEEENVPGDIIVRVGWCSNVIKIYVYVKWL